MIILAVLIVFFMYQRWSIVHLHTSGDRQYVNIFKNGDIVYDLGVKSTVIDCKTVDMVIRRHLSGLILPRRHHDS